MSLNNTEFSVNLSLSRKRFAVPYVIQVDPECGQNA